MPRVLTEHDVEWKECRDTIGRFDTIIADLRKYSFTLVTALITAGAYLGGQTPSLATTTAVPSAIMMLIAVLFAVDRYYYVLQSGAVERALDIEGPELDPNDRTRDSLTQVIALHAVRSKSAFTAALLYLILLVAAFGLAQAAQSALSADALRRLRDAHAWNPAQRVDVVFWACVLGIAGYYWFTERVNNTGSFRPSRLRGPSPPREARTDATPFHQWDALPDEVISPHYSTATGGTVTGAIIEVGRYRMAGGTGADPHKHPNEQIIYVLEGRLRARVGAEERVVEAGEVILVHPDVVHEIRALEDSLFLSSKNLVDGRGSKGWSAAAPVPRPKAR